MATLRTKNFRPGFLTAVLACALALGAMARAGQKEELQEAIRLDPKNPVNYYNLGMLYLQSQDPGNALPNLEKAAKLDKGDNKKQAQFFVEFCRGFIAYNQKDYKGAIPAFEKAKALDPQFPDNIKYLAYSYYKGGKPESAEAAIKAFIQGGGQDAQMSFLLGIILNDRKDFKGALDAYKSAADIKPDYAQAVEAAARVCVSGTKDYKTALVYLEKLVTLQPNNPNAPKYMGVCYQNTGNREKALEAYSQALKLNPKDTDVLYNMSKLYKDNGQFTEAMDALEKMKQAAPDRPNVQVEAQNYRASIIVEAVEKLKDLANNKFLEDDLLGAKQAYEQVLRLEAEDEQAREEVVKVKAKVKDKVASLKRTGDQLQAKGDTAGAIQSWSEALGLDPENKDVKAAMDAQKAKKADTIKAYIIQGDQAARLHNFEKAKAKYNEAIRVGANKAEVEKKIAAVDSMKAGEVNDLFQDAQNLESSRHYQDAIDAYEQVLNVDPANDKARSRIFAIKARRADEIDRLLSAGQNASKAGKTKEAQDAFTKALDLDPKNQVANAELKKLTGTKAVVAVSYENVQAAYQKGMGLYLQEKFKDALDVWEGAAKKNPNDAKVKAAIQKARVKLEVLRSLGKG